MSQQSSDSLYFGPLARVLYFVIAVTMVVVGRVWVYVHPLELAMDVLAPMAAIFLVFARRRDDTFVKLSLAATGALMLVMIAAAEWLKVWA